jgi:hypothetical protein
LLEIVIPSSVEFIGESCFLKCGSLASLTFESGLTLSGIDRWAFTQTRLIEVVIPASVEFMGEDVSLVVDHLSH